MTQVFLRIGSLLALLAVALGAFAAHGLDGKIPEAHLHNFETGVRYHIYHALAILLVGVLIRFGKTKSLVAAGWLFTAGIVLFSGSLYLLAIRSWFDFSVSWLGPITPLGGLLLIVGWALLFFSSFSRSPKMPVG